MRLLGLSVNAQVAQGYTLTPLPSTARDLVKGKQLELLIDLCDSLPKSAKQGAELRTKNYSGLHSLIFDRTGRKWDSAALSNAKKGLLEKGAIIVDGNGDLVINYDAFEKRALYSERDNQKPTSAPAQTEAIEREGSQPAKREEPQPEPALTASGAPVINVAPFQVIDDIERQMEPQHVHANRSAMDDTPRPLVNRRGESYEPLKRSAKELEYERAAAAHRAEQQEMAAFAEAIDYTGDPRMIWDNRDAWGYQEWKNPPPKPEPQLAAVGASSSGIDEDERW